MWRLLILASSLLHAEEWFSARNIYEGQELLIETRDGQRHTAWFLSKTSDAFVVRTKTGERSFAKKDVRLVAARTNSRGTRAAKGALIGLSIPLFGAMIARNAEPLPYTAPFALYGALLGSIVKTHEPVYRANVP